MQTIIIFGMCVIPVGIYAYIQWVISEMDMDTRNWEE